MLLLSFLPMGFAQDVRPIVRLIYFLPNDRAPQPDIDEKMDKVIKDVQQFYADQMEVHGFGRKTFVFETDAQGNAVVHHIVGRFTDEYYSNLSNTLAGVNAEVDGQFNFLKNILLIAVDISDIGPFCGIGGISGRQGGGGARVNARKCLTWEVVAHELGHAFGLNHDFRGPAYIMSYSYHPHAISRCTAEWLNVHRAFNPSRPFSNKGDPIIEMLPPSLVAPPNVVRLRFKVTDPDGLHLAHFATDGRGLACKRLNGTSNTVEFITSTVLPEYGVGLTILDVQGNFGAGVGRGFKIDLTSLLPPAEDVSIPDRHLAAAVREEIGNSITTHTLLSLLDLHIRNSGITDLTGLEHAHNLVYLSLGAEFGERNNNNSVSDFSPIENLRRLTSLDLSYISLTDVSPLSELTQLINLYLGSNNITDVSPLSELTQLTHLELWSNNITDVSPLSELTQLINLYLGSNNITDVSPLSELTQLRELRLWSNNITDVSPLSELTQLINLYLGSNNITDVSPLSELTQLRELDIRFNPLSHASIHTHIPAMQARGIEVLFDDVAHPALVKISGDAQEGLLGTPLAAPLIVEAQDEHGKPMRGVSVTFAVDAGGGTLNPKTTKTDANGRAQTTLTPGWTPGTITIRATATGIKAYVRFTATTTVPIDRRAEDVNADGAVDVEDLVFVASSFGAVPTPDALPDTDVNNDGDINQEDLELVLAALEGAPAAPSLNTQWIVSSLQQWIAEAKQWNSEDAIFQRGIIVLEELLADLLPKQTLLLANYPNPFNPETWIPYQLSEPADVVVRIYEVKGALVRTLELGHQLAGTYHNRTRAVYWDGRNSLGEAVASGVYFYTLSAGDFTATRKMLIQK